MLDVYRLGSGGPGSEHEIWDQAIRAARMNAIKRKNIPCIYCTFGQRSRENEHQVCAAKPVARQKEIDEKNKAK